MEAISQEEPILLVKRRAGRAASRMVEEYTLLFLPLQRSTKRRKPEKDVPFCYRKTGEASPLLDCFKNTLRRPGGEKVGSGARSSVF